MSGKPFTDAEDDRIQKMAASDPDNPEWTEEDFAKARPPHEVLPPHILAAFPHTRGPAQGRG